MSVVRSPQHSKVNKKSVVAPSGSDANQTLFGLTSNGIDHPPCVSGSPATKRKIIMSSPTKIASTSSSSPTPGSRTPAAQIQQGRWQTVSTKRKGSPLKTSSVGKQTKLTSYWLGPPAVTANQFDVLSDEVVEPPAIVEPKPPPIFINDVDNIAPLQALLLSVAPEGYNMKIINSNSVKIISKSKDSYTAIIKSLTEKSTKFHTYQLKEDRAFRVVLRHVHHTTDKEDIKKEFELLGHTVRNIHVIIQRMTKLPLPMFYIDLEPRPNNKDVYKIELFMHQRIKIEPPRQKREIVQCTKCQRYGHTKHFCYNIARCVKCVGNHPTESCNRDQSVSNVQCVLCKGNHSANYKGCEIYKQLQAKKYPQLRLRSSLRLDGNQNMNPTTSNVQPNISYAQAVNQSQTISQPRQPSTANNINEPGSSAEKSSNNDIIELKQMMKVLVEQMSNMMNLLTVIVTKLHA